MDYNKLLQGILDIGEAMAKSGAENFRIEDSLYRICKSYGFKRYDAFTIPTNIQMTVETPEGEIITQIRHIDSRSNNYDRLDYLNNLCRYVCTNTPDETLLQEKFQDVMHRPPQKSIYGYLANILGGVGFTVFFGGNFADACVAFLISIMMVYVGRWLVKKESNLMVYNMILAFMAEVVIIFTNRIGAATHPDRIMIGIVMLLISALGVINGIRELLQRHFVSGLINIMNSILGAFGIAFGIAGAMLMFDAVTTIDPVLNHSVIVQLISCTIGCTGFAWMFKIKGIQILYSSIGAFCTWGIYLIAYELKPNNFVATLAAAIFVGSYAFFMARINRAPSTIFLTAAVFPIMPGSALYYLMFACVSKDFYQAFSQAYTLLETCLAIALGFILQDLAARVIMHTMKRNYRITKSTQIFQRK